MQEATVLHNVADTQVWNYLVPTVVLDPFGVFLQKRGVPYPEPQIKPPSPTRANNDAVPRSWLGNCAARFKQLVVREINKNINKWHECQKTGGFHTCKAERGPAQS